MKHTTLDKNQLMFYKWQYVLKLNLLKQFLPLRRSEASRCGIVIVHGSGGRAGGRKQKWTTGPRVTKFGREVRPNTLVISTGNGVSSYFRSAAICHFENLDILNFGPFLPNGLIKMHKIWYGGHTMCPANKYRKWRHWLLPIDCTAAILIFTLRRRFRKRFRRISPNLIGLTRKKIFLPKMNYWS